MNGAHYRALRRLSNAADETLAQVGETCERVPESSLPLLLASGKIEPVLTKPDAPEPARPETIRMTLDSGILFNSEDGA